MAPDRAIVAANVVKTFDLGPRRNRAFSAVRGISFEVRSETLFGFLGPNGAGKTTTIKMMTGLIFPTAGSLEILGGSPSQSSIRAKVGFLPENPTFPDHLTAGEVLGFAARLLALAPTTIAVETQRTLKLVDLTRAADIPVRKFSKGMVQRLGIAQALLGEPKLVILDEPMSGLDPIGRRDIKDLILRLRKEGKTVFFSTHIISDVEEICDDVAIVVNGALARQGRVAEMIDSSAKEVEITARGIPSDFAGRLDQVGEVATLVVKGEAELRATLERIWNNSGTVTRVQARHYGLEQVFLEAVQREPNRSVLRE